MPDPVGLVSLTLQLLDGCMKTYKILNSVVHMPESCAERRVKLMLEHNLLISWATEAGWNDGSPLSSMTDFKGSSIDAAAVLSAIRTVLETISQCYRRYEELRNDRVGQNGQPEVDLDSIQDVFTVDPAMLLIPDEDSSKHHALSSAKKVVSRLVQGSVQAFRHPERVRWVCLDEKKVDDALNQLNYYTSRLRAFTGDSRLRAIQERTEAIFMEVVQNTQSQKELAGLVQGVLLLLKNSSVATNQPELGAKNELEILRDLASLKELIVANALGNELPGASIKLHHNEDVDIIKMATYQEAVSTTKSDANVPELRSQTVWIEWKGYGPKDVKIGPELGANEAETMRNNIRDRTAQLARLLSFPKPGDFCTPKCLGFFEEPENHRFGWVFTHPSRAASQPKSLRSLFSANVRPSLTERAALARKLSICLLYLHAVDWLHKAFRSDNILFFDHGDVVELSAPVVSGFDLSRPDNEDSKTIEKTLPNIARDLYRWPTSQTSYQDENRWCKTFDIYGLGIVLIEIAHWQPIEQIMGFDKISDVTSSKCVKLQSNILHEPQYLTEILERTGRRYHDAVKACIQGYEAFGLGVNDNQSDPSTAIKLQRQYRQKVVAELKRMDV